jgi:hypothetical protein
MAASSAFNCIFCSIYIFSPVIFCTEYLSDYFCSSISSTYSAQYYKIIFASYFCQSVKLCSNLTYLLMNVNRYLLIGKEHAKVFVRISEFRFAKTLRFMILIGGLLSVGSLFKYNLNEGNRYRYGTYYSYELYPIYNTNSAVFPSFSLVYLFSDFIVFAACNMAIEIAIVKRLRTEITARHERLVVMSSSLSPSALQKKIGDERKKEQRAVLMVVSNSVVTFFLRLPEFFAFVGLSHVILPDNSLHLLFCARLDLCSDMLNTKEFFFILTFTANFLNYYFFNLKFRQAFLFWPHVKAK